MTRRKKRTSSKSIAQNPTKRTVWKGLSTSKTANIERNLSGIIKKDSDEFLSEELARYKGIKIIED